MLDDHALFSCLAHKLDGNAVDYKFYPRFATP